MQPKEPKDLGIKIAENAAVALWTRVRDAAEQQLIQSRDNITVQTAVKALAVRKIEEEKRKI